MQLIALFDIIIHQLYDKTTQDYRKLLKGQKSKITNDKVAKLIEIGFVFDASGIKTDMTKEDINNCHSENEGDGTVYDEL